MKRESNKNRLVYALCGVIVCVAAVAIARILSPGQNDYPADTEEEVGTASGLVLVEDEFVRIIYNGSGMAEFVDGTAYLYFQVDNLSDQEFTVYPMDSYVNDTVILLGSAVPATVAADKSYSYPLIAAYSGIGIESYDDLNTLETKFWLMAEDGSTLEELGPFTVEFTQEVQ